MPPARTGSVLLIVLVVVMMLSFATYVFTQTMLVERRIGDAFEHDVRARTAVDSAIELAAAYLGEQREPGDEGFYHRPELFHGMIVYPPSDTSAAGRFSVLAPLPLVGDEGGNPLRFGLMDESGLLNLNAFASEAEEERLLEVAAKNDGFVPLAVAGDVDVVDDAGMALAQRERLLVFPGMTEELADAILDWVDEDDEPRALGAEGPDYYESLPQPYTPTNGPLESIDELLLVKGVTRSLLYGEDANRNGLLDPNENDGDETFPRDDADGMLNPGWSAFFTVYAREINLRTDGTERIDLNQDLLTELFDALEPELGEEMAQFVVAFRVAGPIDQEAETQNPLSGLASGDQQAAQELAVAIAKAVASGDGSATRAGIDLLAGAAYRIESLYDLVDAQVEIEVDGTLTTLDSPWSSDGLKDFMPDLVNMLATTDAPFVEGRVNVNEARYETLLTIPGMTEETASLIVKSIPIGSGGEPLTDEMYTRATTAWLVMKDIVDLPTMRRLDRYLTSRGNVHRAQIVGYFDHGGPVSRVEVVLDATELPVRVAAIRDLTPLGMGYPRTWLVPTTVAPNLTDGSSVVSGSTTTAE